MSGVTPSELVAVEEGEAAEEEVGVEAPAVAAAGAYGCSCCRSVTVVETVVLAEGAEVEAAGPAEETEEACAGVVAGLVSGGMLTGVVAGLVSGGMLTGAEAVVGAVGTAEAEAEAAAETEAAVATEAATGAGAEAEAAAGAGAEAEAAAAPEAGEGASGPGDQLNAGCDVGDCESHAAGCPIWMPPSSYARKRPCQISLVHDIFWNKYATGFWKSVFKIGLSRILHASPTILT